VEFKVDWLKPHLVKLVIAAIVSGISALFVTSGFQNQMPMAEWFYNFDGLWLMPLSSLNLVFHEAGHWIFGILGIRFITVAGVTLMQLLLPSICLGNFVFIQKSPVGSAFCLFWVGENLMEVSWYMADAKVQALILITGMSGREGGDMIGGPCWGG
jgi:hypothetical protein